MKIENPSDDQCNLLIGIFFKIKYQGWNEGDLSFKIRGIGALKRSDGRNFKEKIKWSSLDFRNITK